jgi:hypothetical protein
MQENNIEIGDRKLNRSIAMWEANFSKLSNFMHLFYMAISINFWKICPHIAIIKFNK